MAVHITRHRALIPAFLLPACLALPAAARDDTPQPPAPPPLPDQAAEREAIEPEVTIIQRGGERVEEYRINGRLYLIRITPAKGYPYYLMDTDGDGSLDSRRDELDPKVLIPHWVIFRW